MNKFVIFNYLCENFRVFLRQHNTIYKYFLICFTIQNFWRKNIEKITILWKVIDLQSWSIQLMQKKDRFYKSRQNGAMSLIFKYVLYNDVLVIHTKFQVHSSLHWAFTKSAYFEQEFYQEFLGWSTLRPSTKVNLRDRVTNNISLDRELSRESRVATVEIQTLDIGYYTFYTETLTLKF